MASSGTVWTAPSLARYRPVLLALTALAAGCTIYYVHDQIWSRPVRPKPSLQRSNARRHRRRPRRRPSAGLSGYGTPGTAERTTYVPDVPWGTVPVSLDFLTNTDNDRETFGEYLFHPASGNFPTFSYPICRQIPLEHRIHWFNPNFEEASTIRRELEVMFLCFYFWKHIPPSPISDEQRSLIISQLGENGGFSAERVTNALNSHQAGTLVQSIASGERLLADRVRALHESQWPQPETLNDDSALTMQALEGQETVTDVDSEHPWREENGTNDGQDDGREDSKEGQNLGNLLWRIAEEQARKESYVHRGVTCNSCNAMPIKGIRYRCSNCVDFDLCEQCEALQTHPNTHLFYKVRIPAAFLGNSRQPQPVWYPGRPTAATHNIPKEIMEKIKRETEYQAVEIEALWEQYRCLAATEFEEDPCEYNLAIDRRTFDKCLVPSTSTRPPAPNLVYDRAFSFYDTNNDGLIGFEEFINGRAALSKKNPDERWKRVFKGYDIDNDGFVDRKDFLRMFRAYYTLTKELTLDTVNEMEDNVSEDGAREIVLGSQPISSAFSGAIPSGGRPRMNQTKMRDEYGDYQIYDEIGGVIDNRDHDVADPEDVLADSVEAARFEHVQRKGIMGPWVGDSIKNDEWPPRCITHADLQKVLPYVKELNEITSLEDQHAIRRAAHERIAREHQERQFVRRIAVRNRKQRQSFYLDDNDAAKEEKMSDFENEKAAFSLSKTDRSRKKDLMRILGSSKVDEFRMHVIESIKAMQWPLESPLKLMNDVCEMILNEWGGREIAEDLAAYGSLEYDATDFVATFDSIISLVSDAIKVPGVQESADEQRKSIPSSSSRRSRSSSKVRFRDDVGTDDEHESRSRATSMSSRSIPVNERWGGLIPEAEKDVGQEVLYQVTQEALNELLDPVFRLREDLALAALRTRREREQYRAAIVASVKDPRIIKGHLYTYQKEWRRHQQHLSSGYLGSREIGETFGAEDLLKFLKFLGTENYENYEAAERCSRHHGCIESGAESWMEAEFYCSSCYKLHAQEPEAKKPDDFLKTCPNCVTGRLTPAHCCRSCGCMKEIYEENEKLRKILWGAQGDSVQDVVQGDVQGEEELKSTPNQDSEPVFPAEALDDLHNSVTAYNEANPSVLEDEITHRDLGDLLAASGYAPFSPKITSRDLMPSPGPMFPLNRLDDTDDHDLILQLSEAIDVETRTSTSHLSSHPTTQPQSPSRQSEERPKSPTPDPTLPQNRPNTNSTPPTKSKSIDETNTTPTSTSAPSPELTPKAAANNKDSSAENDDDEAAATDNATNNAPPLDLSTLAYYAALSMIDAEDRERGGPGRLSFAEWQDVIKGNKGPMLGFLGSWIEIASF